MIFYEPLAARCSPSRGAARSPRALRRRAELCGVFVNAPLDEVVATRRRARR